MKLDAVQQAAQEQFARQSHRYGRSHILQNVEDVQAAIDPLNLPAGARALDIATGAGHTGLYLAGRGYQVTLTDVAEPMLQRAREAAAERGLTIATRQHLAEELPYADASFDLVTCRVAAHHFSDPEKFIAETARVLAPGGWFVLIDGSVEDDQPEAEAWIHAVEKFRDPSHHRFLTPRAWSKLCSAHSLTVTASVLNPFKQPDLEWYFETAATSPENREQVRALVANAPESARKAFGLAEEDGKIVWWWHRLTLTARKQ